MKFSPISPPNLSWMIVYDDDDDDDDADDDDDNVDDEEEAPRRLRRDEQRYKRETKQDKPSMPLSNNKTRQVIV